jgi:hypothetical protein
MCPACMATAAALIAGATSAGSVIAFIVGTQKGRRVAAADQTRTQTGDNHGTTEDRVAR